MAIYSRGPSGYKAWLYLANIFEERRHRVYASGKFLSTAGHFYSIYNMLKPRSKEQHKAPLTFNYYLLLN